MVRTPYPSKMVKNGFNGLVSLPLFFKKKSIFEKTKKYIVKIKFIILPYHKFRLFKMRRNKISYEFNIIDTKTKKIYFFSDFLMRSDGLISILYYQYEDN